MAEKCPLSPGEHRINDTPEYCLGNCVHLWCKAEREQQGLIDWYDDPEDGCDHEHHGVEFSHEGLYKPDDSPAREYIEVHRCEGCRSELYEISYFFNCPNN